MTSALLAFLSLIAWSEGTSTSPLTSNNGYDVIVGGLDGGAVFTDYSDHPFAPQFRRAPVRWRLDPPEYSTASGRYQLLYRWWPAYRAQLGLKDFSPASQDAVALQQMKERGAVALVMAGSIQAAVKACAETWASFPGNAYGQAGGHAMATLLEKYTELSA